ncbi:MAG: type II DNA modification methyltransferase [Lachnospiraceae bacterium]|nr:type II DNA modification methyltransferase [Lachnospiraceae bacterium]
MEIRQVGNIMPTKKRGNPNQGRVYLDDGLSPALNSCGGGNLEPKVVVAMRDGVVIDDTQGFEEEPRLYHDAAPCPRSERNGLKTMAVAAEGGGDQPMPEADIIQLPRGYNRGGRHRICPSITSNSFQENNYAAYQYRIRKLTPLECWRLMGFSDEDFHKAEGVNSNSQLYKQAGNSIVKDVLMAIFAQMLPKAAGNKNEDGQKGD